MKLYNELIFILVFLFVFFGTLFYYLPAEADGRDKWGSRLRMSTVEVAFEIVDNDYDGPMNTLEEMMAVHGPIERVELWCIFRPGSATMEYVATLNNTDLRTWELEPILLPIGIDLPYYLKMFYTDGHMSPSSSAYMFALTKPAVIENFRKEN